METAPVWLKLRVEGDAPVLEALADLLVAWGAGGVVWEGEAAVVYFEPAARETVDLALGAYAADLAVPLAWRWEEDVGETWRDSWKAFFRPGPLSRRLAVCPSWEPAWRPDDPSVRVLRMDPGRAFGTGTHETTRLCLDLLDEETARDPVAELLDIGCGSGVLSIGCLLLGTPRAVALDLDPIATGATRDNARANGVADRLRIVCGDLRALRGTYPLVVANILYQVLLGLAPGIVQRVAPGGRLLLSGMLIPELPSASAVYGRLGLVEERRETLGEWGALVLRKG